MEIECVVDIRAMTGESPVWHAKEQALYWVDIPGCTFNRYDPATGENRVWRTPESVGSFAMRASGGFLLAMPSGFHAFDPQTERYERLGEPQDLPEGHRFNDGRCDPRGRMWAGCMHASGKTEQRGNLYSFGTDHQCRNEVSGFQVFNSLAWTQHGRQVYFSDSRGHVIFTADYDLERGRIFNKRIWKRTDPAWGVPDGAAMDAEGCYWVAFFGGSKIVRYRLDGSIEREIQVPVERPTMPCFGGPNLDVLYFTSGSNRYTDADFQRDPKAGAVFRCEPGVQGLPEPAYQG